MPNRQMVLFYGALGRVHGGGGRRDAGWGKGVHDGVEEAVLGGGGTGAWMSIKMQKLSAPKSHSRDR